MAFFTWRNEYRVDVPAVDAQHRRLFDLAEELFEAMRTGQGKEVTGRALQQLINYTTTHFAEEERMMAQHNYPHLKEHCALHQELTQKVLEFQQRFQSGNAFLTVDLMHFLKSWLEDHIKREDLRYVSFVSARAGGIHADE